ncbi:MAG: HAD hydrolase-like protein, partial [Alkalinema sp. RL_2_19]|nr:HAD hydrolase-like protein [Alkalinema sp. RL_2_19]
IGTPEPLAQINVQAETTLHNIEGIHGRVRAFGAIVCVGGVFRYSDFESDFIALQKHHCSANQAWHIGDSLEEDYRAATAAGLNGIWLQR